MKKKLLLITPAFIALLASGCNVAPAESSVTPGGDSSVTSSETSQGGSSENSSSEQAPTAYTITFKDENGELLESKEWPVGSKPFYTYVKDDTAEWDYTVNGWATSQGGEVVTVPAVSAEATYYAVVSKVKKQYSITFDSNSGSNVDTITADYGTVVNAPTKPTKSGHKFVGWTYDKFCLDSVEWPITLDRDLKLYANWNETIDLKAYLSDLLGVTSRRPSSYIPDSMKPTYSANHVGASDVDYDFTVDTDVSDIKYGGFGEQWHMVLENIEESDRFFAALTAAQTFIEASAIVYNNFIDNNPSEDDTYAIDESNYKSSFVYKNNHLTYTLEYKHGYNIPFFGEVLPKIEMTYSLLYNHDRTVKISLNEHNAMKYCVNDKSYEFGIEYAVSAVSRKAYFYAERKQGDSVEGHIYEYLQYKDKDLTASCADFYIDDTYVSVVGNKADGMPGFTGYINELYKVNQGKLLGYEVRETFTKWGISATYHTLWFNLNNITGINSVKAIENGSHTYGLGGENAHDIYLNGSASIFEPTYNKKLMVNTSRKYDVELRKQYFYGEVDDKIVEYKTEIPMMFIQADHDSYTNFTDFPSDILAKSGITASVNLSSTYLAKIQSDYAELIDTFIENKDKITAEMIVGYIEV